MAAISLFHIDARSRVPLAIQQEVVNTYESLTRMANYSRALDLEASDYKRHAEEACRERVQLERLRTNEGRTARVKTLEVTESLCMQRWERTRQRHASASDILRGELERFHERLQNILHTLPLVGTTSAQQPASEQSIASLATIDFLVAAPSNPHQLAPPHASNQKPSSPCPSPSPNLNPKSNPSPGPLVAPLGAGSTPCAICFVELSTECAVRLPCEHMFHRTCVTSWLRRSNTCPLCRRKLEDDDDH